MTITRVEARLSRSTRRRARLDLGADGAGFSSSPPASSRIALVVLGLLASTYQPLAFGGSAGGTFPGLPAGSPGRPVNSCGGLTPGSCIPAQRGVFTIVESIQNTGPNAVTIEAVSMTHPVPHAPSWPLVAAGHVLYMPEYYTRGQRVWKAGRPFRGLSLAPAQDITVDIPVRMARACYVRSSVITLNVFYVEERFLTFTQWVALPLGAPIMMREPEGPGGPGVVCPN